jgi:hypothetical protein
VTRGRLAGALLLAIGLAQMTGDLLAATPLAPAARALKGIAAATGASPAPKVFSAVRGLETYSTRFTLEWTGRDGLAHTLPLTPELYARLAGPYNRRNVYGAALAYGPVLPASLREPVTRYALCGDAPLLRELGIDPATIEGQVRVRYEAVGRRYPEGLPNVIEGACR